MDEKELEYARSFVKRLQGYCTTNEYHCWLIHNSIDQNTGYYIATYHNKSVRGHRKIYELFFNDLKEGLVIDHMCGNTNCLNPEHLEQVTVGENSRRGHCYDSPTHCKHGHEYTPENTYTIPKSGHKSCMICRRRADQKRHVAKKLWKQNNKDKVNEYHKKYHQKHKDELNRKKRQKRQKTN